MLRKRTKAKYYNMIKVEMILEEARQVSLCVHEVVIEGRGSSVSLWRQSEAAKQQVLYEVGLHNKVASNDTWLFKLK